MTWDAEPPPRDDGRQRVEIVRVPAGATWRVVVTATRLLQVYTHFTDGRTKPCGRPARDCIECRRGLARRFEAYAGVHNLSRRVDQVLVIPLVPYYVLETELGLHLHGGMRGEVLELSRPEGSRRAPLKVTCLRKTLIAVPPGLDVPAICCRAWGVDRKDFEVPPAEATG